MNFRRTFTDNREDVGPLVFCTMLVKSSNNFEKSIVRKISITFLTWLGFNCAFKPDLQTSTGYLTLRIVRSSLWTTDVSDFKSLPLSPASRMARLSPAKSKIPSVLIRYTLTWQRNNGNIYARNFGARLLKTLRLSPKIGRRTRCLENFNFANTKTVHLSSRVIIILWPADGCWRRAARARDFRFPDVTRARRKCV